MTKCPIVPAAQAMIAITKPCAGQNGVSPDNSAPTSPATNSAMNQLRQLKLWLMLGAAGGTLR